MQSRISLFIALLFTLFSCQQEQTTTDTAEKQASKRIISLSGFLTDVLFELGYGDQIVATDVTSIYPEAANKIEKLGHISQLNTEAILALKPDYIFVDQAQMRKSAALAKLQDAAINIIPIHTQFQLNNALSAARQLKSHLDVSDKYMNDLAQKIKQDSMALAGILAKHKEATQPKVLFIYARGSAKLLVSGTGTASDAIITKAGGQNAIQSFENYKPLTPEALLEAQPDVILMFNSGLASLDGKEGLSQIAGITQTPAYINNRIISMNAHYLTAFGPQAAAAASSLAKQLYAPNSEK